MLVVLLKYCMSMCYTSIIIEMFDRNTIQIFVVGVVVFLFRVNSCGGTSRYPYFLSFQIFELVDCI